MNFAQFGSRAVLWLIACSASAAMLDETPTGPGDWGYRPENSAVAINPPGFTWRPSEGIEAYILQLASDSGFDTIVYSSGKTRWNAHCPDQSFAPGTYYWRYKGIDANGNETGWSQVRTCTIPETAVKFPQPRIDAVIARIPAEHPRLFFAPEDVPTFKELAKGPLAGRWSEIVDQANTILANPPDFTEPPKYPEGMERKGEEWRKIWWGNRTRVIAVADSAATLAFVYRLTGEEKYGSAARDFLMEMTKWDPNGSTSRDYNDEASMPAMKYPARAYSWCYPMFSESDRRIFVEMMRIRGRQAFDHLVKMKHLWRPYDSHSNRLWHFLGDIATVFYDDIPEAKEWLDFVMTIQFTCYPAWSDSDGGWHEGVAYWVSYITRYMYWATTMENIYEINVFEMPFFKQVGFFGMYMLPPGAMAGGYGDQAIGINAKQTGDLVAILNAGARNPYWQWYVEQTGGALPSGYLGFIYAWKLLDVSAKPPIDLPQSKAFQGTGVAVMNSDLMDAKNNVQIHFKDSPIGRQSHGYNANNSFLLHIAGERVFLNSGKRDISGSPHHTQWMWETKSDNAILVNGEGQIPHSFKAKGRITRFETSPTFDFVEGECAESYPQLTTAVRRILFFKPGVIVIHDILTAKNPSTFQWLLHAPGEFKIGENQTTWSGKPATVRVRWLEPSALKISQTDQFDTPPAEWAKFDLGEWHLTASTTEKVLDQQFVTLITVEGKSDLLESELSANDSSRTLKLKRAGGETTIELGPDSVTARTGSTILLGEPDITAGR
ncbi:MAG: heparinase [Candidatus Hydrogenedentota bacterium]